MSWYKKVKGHHVAKNCKICDKEFTVFGNKNDTKIKYCSEKCRAYFKSYSKGNKCKICNIKVCNVNDICSPCSNRINLGGKKNIKENAKYKAIHMWLRKHKPKPDFCEKCNKELPQEMANITGVYDRNPINYKWFCTKCHRRHDYKPRKRDKNGRFK